MTNIHPLVITLSIIIFCSIVFGAIYEEVIYTDVEIVHDVNFTKGHKGTDVIIDSYGRVHTKGLVKCTKELTTRITDKAQLDSIKIAHEAIIYKDIDLLLSVSNDVGSSNVTTATKVN